MSAWNTQIMVYAGGDAASRFPGLQQDLWRQLGLLQRFVTNRRVCGLFQLDGTTAPSVRGILDPAARFQFEPLGETNTGDPNELIDFITWARRTCPSEHSVLVLSGHGLAWQDARTEANLRPSARGINLSVTDGGESRSIRHVRKIFRPTRKSPDPLKAMEMETRALLIDGNTRNGTEDYLSNSELGEALERATALNNGKKFDAIVFDACLMSSVEVLCELKDSASTVVGAVDEISATGLNLAGAARQISEAQPGLSSRDIAVAFSQTYSPAANSDSCIATDIESKSFSAALEDFAALSTRLSYWLQASPTRRTQLKHCLERAVSLVRFRNQSVCDLGSLQASLEDLPDLPSDIRERLVSAIENFKAAVLAKRAGSDYEKAIGLSCFVPSSGEDYLFNRPDYTRLRFNYFSRWSAVLDQLYL